MKTRLTLLVMLAIAVWSYFPETRRLLLQVTAPILRPIVKPGVDEELRQVGRNVVEHERLTGELPTGPGWLPWLEYRYSSDDIMTDPWGSLYQLEVERDSVAIVSLGPDRTRGTRDDFRLATPRG